MASARRPLELSTLSTFLALIEERSVTRASQRLHMTQSGVSHALRRLRAYFDDPLLVRASDGMQPTPRALELHEQIARIVGEIESLGNDREYFDPSSAHRTFTLGADDNMSLLLIPRLLEHLHYEAAGIELSVVPALANPRLALEQGQLDLVFGLLEPEKPGLYTKRLCTESFVVVARRGHPTMKRRPSAEQFAAAAHVIVSTRLPSHSFVDQQLADLGLRRRIALRIAHFLVAFRVVERSDLILTAPKTLAEEAAKTAPLQLFEPPIPLPTLEIYQTWHELMHNDPAHQWLRGLIGELMAPVGPPQG